MTTHLAPLPPPSPSDISGQVKNDKPSVMAFYTEAIKLYNILDRILSDVYKAWCGLSRPDQSRLPVKNLGGLDTILEIGNQLVHFESELPFFLKWGQIQSPANVDMDLSSTLAQQKNVLHARYVDFFPPPNGIFLMMIHRYIHLHLLLYRPIFTQLYSERVRQQKMVDRSELPGNSKLSPTTVQSDLYSSMASKCETACIMAAIDLTHLIHDTYQTNAADAWWYNGFCMLIIYCPLIIYLMLIENRLDISTAAVVLLMSLSAPPILDQSIMEKARGSWRQAMAVLGNMATFRHSAGNTLQFLQDAYRQAVPDDLHVPGLENDASKLPREIDQSNDSFDHSHQDLVQASFFNWEEFAANVEPDLDDLAFLTRLDFRQG